MRPVYSRRFFAGSPVGKSRVLYPPAGRIWVVRDVDVMVDLGFSGGFVIGTSGGWFWSADWATAASGDLSKAWRGRQVIPVGDYLHLSADPGVIAHISGYELTAE